MGHPLDLGTTTFGILIDGYDDTEHAPCSLTVGDFGKLTIEANFPYLEPFNLNEAGEHLWVNKKPIPKRMVFRHGDGEIELFGITFTGSTTPLGNGKTARISCGIALAVEGQVPDEGDDPRFSSLRQTFYNPKAISPIGMHRLEFGTGEDLQGPDRSIKIPATREIWKWSFEGFDHVISEVHRTIHEPGRTEISTRLEFETTTSEPKTFQEFYIEQQKFVALMQILNAKQIPLVDPYVLLPNIDKPMYQRLRSGRVRNSLIRESAEREEGSCIAISQLHPQNLFDWYANQPKYLRAVSALSSLLPRIEIDAEERMINSFIALETIGHISLGYKFGERGAQAAEYVDECLKLLGVELLEFSSSTKAFSKALVLNYNGIKHPKTAGFPDVMNTAFFGIVTQGIARAALIKQTLGILVDLNTMPELTWAHAVAKQEKITIDE